MSSDAEKHPTPQPFAAAMPTAPAPPPHMTDRNGGSDPPSLSDEAIHSLLGSLSAKVDRIDAEMDTVVTAIESHAETLQKILLNQEKILRQLSSLGGVD